MEEEHFSIKMETDTMVIGSMVLHKEREEWFMLMKTFMKANGMRERETDMEFWLKEMEIILKVTGLTTWERVKAVTITMIKINYSLVNGFKINQRQESILKLRTMRQRKLLRNLISQIHMYFHQYMNSN